MTTLAIVNEKVKNYFWILKTGGKVRMLLPLYLTDPQLLSFSRTNLKKYIVIDT
jgi:hypothetical protein